MDVFDQAQELELRQREAAIRAQQKALAGEGREDCFLCGEPIGEERLKAMPNAVRCIDCQERRERWKSRRSR